MKNKDFYLMYIAFNQVHLELIDQVAEKPIYKQRLKQHLKQAQKIMEHHIKEMYEADEKAYNYIVGFADLLLSAVEKESFAHVMSLLKAVKDGELIVQEG